MRRAWPAKGTGTAWRSRSGRASAHPGSAHYGLAGTNGAAINRLARDRRGAASGHARPGRLWLNLPGSRTRLLLLQTRHHVGARRYDWTSGRLSCEIWTRLRTQRCARSGTGQRRGAFARGRGRTSYRLGWKRHRHRRHGRRGSGRRQGLPRTRQDLAGARRGNGTRRNWTSAQRGCSGAAPPADSGGLKGAGLLRSGSSFKLAGKVTGKLLGDETGASCAGAAIETGAGASNSGSGVLVACVGCSGAGCGAVGC